MKNYNVSDYQSWVDLSADMTADLAEHLLFGIPAKHKTYGYCTINSIDVICNESSLQLLATVEINPELTKKLSLNVLLANGLIEVIDPVKPILDEYIAAFTEIQKEVYEVQYERTTTKFEADQQAKEEAKKEAKYQAAKEKAIQDFEVMTKKDKSTNATGEFYYNLGWLAKNVGTISAALPDYLLKYFENHFGTEAKPTVVDSRKRTVNGYPIQWALSMKASVPKKVVDSIPPFLKQYLNPTGNALTNTTFIWDLVENYGFQFGRKQDVEKIRAAVPDFLLEYFEKGFTGFLANTNY